MSKSGTTGKRRTGEAGRSERRTRVVRVRVDVPHSSDRGDRGSNAPNLASLFNLDSQFAAYPMQKILQYVVIGGAVLLILVLLMSNLALLTDRFEARRKKANRFGRKVRWDWFPTCSGRFG